MTAPLPTAGRVVHYVGRSSEAPSNSPLVHRPAVVIHVYDDEATPATVPSVDLHVFWRGHHDGPQAPFVERVRFDGVGNLEGTWHWPEGSPSAPPAKPGKEK